MCVCVFIYLCLYVCMYYLILGVMNLFIPRLPKFSNPTVAKALHLNIMHE